MSRRQIGGGGIRYTAVGTGRPVLVEQIRLTVLLILTGLILIALETTALSRIRTHHQPQSFALTLQRLPTFLRPLRQ